MTVLSGFPRFGKRWPKVIQRGMKGDQPSRTQQVSPDGRIVFCNQARRPYYWCHDCEDFDKCICRPRKFQRRPPYDSRD